MATRAPCFSSHHPFLGRSGGRCQPDCLQRPRRRRRGVARHRQPEHLGGGWLSLLPGQLAGKVDWDEDGPRIALDLDQNPDTGSAFYGTEVMVAFEGEGHAREGRAVLYRSDGWD